MGKLSKETETTAVVAQDAPAFLQQAATEAKVSGMEQLDSTKHFSIPLLKITQGLSPNMDPKNEQLYNPDARIGQWWSADFSETHDEITVTPVFVKHEFIEYVPRTKGGGYVATHKPDAPAVLEAYRQGPKLYTQTENELVENLTYLMLMEQGEKPPVIVMLPFKTTMLSVARRFNSDLGNRRTIEPGKTVPIYALKYKFGTAMTSNNQGSWALPKFEFLGFNDETTFNNLKEFAEQASSGLFDDALKSSHQRDSEKANTPTQNADKDVVDAVASSMA